MKMKAEVEILFGPTFQQPRSILVESKFKKPPGLLKAKVLPFKNTSHTWLLHPVLFLFGQTKLKPGVAALLPVLFSGSLKLILHRNFKEKYGNIYLLF